MDLQPVGSSGKTYHSQCILASNSGSSRRLQSEWATSRARSDNCFGWHRARDLHRSATAGSGRAAAGSAPDRAVSVRGEKRVESVFKSGGFNWISIIVVDFGTDFESSASLTNLFHLIHSGKARFPNILKTLQHTILDTTLNLRIAERSEPRSGPVGHRRCTCRLSAVGEQNYTSQLQTLVGDHSTAAN